MINIYSTTISQTGNTGTIGFSIEKQGTNLGWFGVHTFQSIYLAVHFWLTSKRYSSARNYFHSKDATLWLYVSERSIPVKQVRYSLQGQSPSKYVAVVLEFAPAKCSFDSYALPRSHMLWWILIKFEEKNMPWPSQSLFLFEWFPRSRIVSSHSKTSVWGFLYADTSGCCFWISSQERNPTVTGGAKG